MKKTFLITAMTALITVGKAQISFGVKGGLNASFVSSLSKWYDIGAPNQVMFDESPIKWGGEFGGFATILFNEKLGFQVELLYSQKGFNYVSKTPYSDLHAKVTLHYIEIPLQLKFNPTKHIYILAGPYVGILPKAYTTSTSFYPVSHTTTQYPSGKSVITYPLNTEYVETTRSIKNYNPIDIGLTAGLGFKAESGFMLGFKYSQGFTDIYKQHYSGKNANSVYQLCVGYEFGKKK